MREHGVLNRVLDTHEAIRPPMPVRMLGALPFLQRIPARIVGVGVLPEHVRKRSPETKTAPDLDAAC